MIQLNVNGVFLDLYEQDSPKVTLQFDSFESFQPLAAFSQTFRIPCTDNNYQFFKTAFDVNGYDFDVTQKHPATILNDGAEFLNGEIRLLKIYHRGGEPFDYEIVFLGDTRSLISTIGNKLVSELDMSDLTHSISMDNVVQTSWSAYPSSTQLDGGYNNGNLLYPLVDFGNTYDENESGNEVSISVGIFNHITNGNVSTLPIQDRIWADRFKPMVRLKYVLDKIFDSLNEGDETWTYESTFLGNYGEFDGTVNDLLFYRTYMSAWGNTDTIFVNPDLGVAKVEIDDQTTVYTGDFNIAQFNEVDVDYNNTWNSSENKFVIQPLGDTTYLVKTRISGTANTNGDDINIKAKILVNGTDTYAYHQGYTIPIPGQDDLYYYYGQAEISLVEGDEVQVQIDCFGGASFSVTSGYFSMNSISDTVNIAPLIQDDYKQIDFLRDLVKMYKLVIVPDNTEKNKYIITPWRAYIGSGSTYDWSDKLDLSKDIQLEPLFNEQDARIEFKHGEEKDWLNDLNTKQFKETFGTLKLDSQNDLLDGQKDVEFKIASTPVTEIQGANKNTGGSYGMGMDNMIIPHIYTLEPGSTRALKTPIVAKTRFLIYNGLKSTGTNSLLDNSWFWRDDDNQGQSSTFFPMVTPYQYMPYPYESGGGEDVVGLDINWQVENGYLRFRSLDSRVSIYDRYWKPYIDLVYDKYSRRVIANFTLDYDDVANFKFSDVIFVKDAYYFVEKIENYELGETTNTKVSLIKLIDFNPAQGGVIPPFTGLTWDEVLTDWDATTGGWGTF